MSEEYGVVVVGAGNAGVSLAARLRRDGHASIALVEPRATHRYRPMLNYAAAAGARMRRYERPTSRVTPGGVDLVADHVVAIDPVARTVRLGSGRELGYATLVLCPGLTPAWEATPGLREGFDAGWAVSAHVPENVDRAARALADVTSGRVVFSVPPEPASCSGTVLKAMFLACDAWRRSGVRAAIDVHLVTPYAGVLGLEPIDSRLRPLLAADRITVHDRSGIASVDAPTRAVRVDGPRSHELTDVALAYVTPRSRAPEFVADAGLAAEGTPGLVDVDPLTLRHVRHRDVWGLGDAATVRTRPSGGALRRQVAVAAANITAAVAGGEPTSHYDGYTVIPIAVDSRRLALAEHTRDGRTAGSVPLVDLTRPRRVTYLFDRFLEPVVYDRLLLRGRV